MSKPRPSGTSPTTIGGPRRHDVENRLFGFRINRLFGHRSFLHSLLALVLVTLVLGLPLWWITGWPSPMIAIGVGYGSHLFADMMTLGGVQFFWPSRLIAVFPDRDEYRVVSGGS
ncbi:MAG TPA: metal-dependent hydrolase, partial [Rubrobacteraceae bacterium]|nr:metal-dependent hydrolase [Rubrobacteraceae bacterium]